MKTVRQICVFIGAVMAVLALATTDAFATTPNATKATAHTCGTSH